MREFDLEPYEEESQICPLWDILRGRPKFTELRDNQGGRNEVVLSLECNKCFSRFEGRLSPNMQKVIIARQPLNVLSSDMCPEQLDNVVIPSPSLPVKHPGARNIPFWGKLKGGLR